MAEFVDSGPGLMRLLRHAKHECQRVEVARAMVQFAALIGIRGKEGAEVLRIKNLDPVIVVVTREVIGLVSGMVQFFGFAEGMGHAIMNGDARTRRQITGQALGVLGHVPQAAGTLAARYPFQLIDRQPLTGSAKPDENRAELALSR